MVYSGISDDTGTISQFTRIKYIYVTTNGSPTPANYQVKLTIAYEPEIQADFSDIRFNTLGNVYINYWIESKTDYVTATVWVELPDAIADPGSDTIWMYYGNGNLSDGSDIRDTMLDGDDFSGASLDANIWNQQYCTVGVSSGILTLDNFLGTGGRMAGGILGKQLVGPSVITEIRIKNVNAGDGMMMGLSNNFTYNTDDSNYIDADHNGNGYGWNYNEGGYGYTGAADTYSANTWYKYKIKHTGSTSHFYRDGVEKTGSPVATNLSNEQMYMMITGDSAYSPTIQVDWIFVRKYITNEPTYIIGTSQHQRRVPQFI